ncbi:MAG: family 20 glycosylhydrolase, partial [Phocaeicola sp.]|nr:family 20 glycosylhydrolase [Phocaeicola sp.]
GSEMVIRDSDDIIREIAEIFPSSSIHLGGDEAAIEKNWTRCDRCQLLMKQLGYTKESQLMNYFFGKILTSVGKYGKKAMLWCELDNIYMPANEYLFDYPKDVTLVTWRNGLTPKCIELTGKYGNPLIMAPGEYAYLDYPQLKGDLPEFNNWGMPVTTLETCYRFDPGYELPDTQQSHILGICGTLWGEAMKDINRVTYMTYPRGLALAEAGWTHMEHRCWDSFKERMYPNLMNLMKQGVSVRVPFEIVRNVQ